MFQAPWLTVPEKVRLSESSKGGLNTANQKGKLGFPWELNRLEVISKCLRLHARTTLLRLVNQNWASAMLRNHQERRQLQGTLGKPQILVGGESCWGPWGLPIKQAGEEGREATETGLRTDLFLPLI